ncbi:hypothetical protein OSB04_023980 [Centaurea solstitialis]|uniref:Reverse transcriptase Ty1/copia-type domain-containing protein n=1 Tax=Centaurea solstitialis TaxID=347529 RepID=A0AA38SKW5_9ASTR|nr:hypothetical protein OSB04_023980 [Centaurea solstitialis]
MLWFKLLYSAIIRCVELFTGGAVVCAISRELPSPTFTLNPEAPAPVAFSAPAIPPSIPIPTPNSEAPTHVASPVPSTHIPSPPGSPDPIHVPSTQPSIPSQQSSSKPSVESTDPRPSSSENVRRLNRVRQVPSHLRDYHCYATLQSNHEPTSYKEASSSSHWQAPMQEELQALAKAQTWDSVPLPSGKRPIGSKWVVGPKGVTFKIRILISEECPDTNVDQGSLYPDESSRCHTKLSSLLSLSSVFRSRASCSCHQLILRLR